ncbi:MAG: 16S rRNA (guanine(527)-N(7))-methyltransferase RsmG [Alcaligenaceae bacterium]
MARPHNVVATLSNPEHLANERLDRALSAFELITTAGQKAALLEYLAQLLRWNKTYNLTAIRDPAQALTQHIFDSLSVVAPIQRSQAFRSAQVSRLIDVGSGGGLPGVVLAIMIPGARVICVDAVEKKTTFVRQMAGVLTLKNLTARHARIETLEPLDATLVISRAFATLQDFAQLAGQHVCLGGALVAMKGKPPTDEIPTLESLTPWTIQRVESLIVPELSAQRCLVWMQRKGT